MDGQAWFAYNVKIFIFSHSKMTEYERSDRSKQKIMINVSYSTNFFHFQRARRGGGVKGGEGDEG